MKRLALLLALLLCFAAPALADTLTLPDSLREVEAEAFMGDASVERVALPDGLEVIGARAFKGCEELDMIVIPDSVREIGAEALPQRTVIRCGADSPAVAYAQAHGNRVILPDDFYGKDINSYPPDRTLDFGPGNFGVLLDSVRTVSGSRSGGAYTVRADAPVRVGDALYIPELQALVQAASVTENADGSYTVAPEENARIQDFYRYLRYEASLDGMAALQGTAEYGGYIQTPRAGAELARFSKTLTYGSAEVQLSAGVRVECSFRYDADLFGPDYLESEVWVSGDADIALKARQEYTLERTIPLLTYSIPTEVPGVLIDLDLTLPVSFTARAQAELSAALGSRLGFAYDSAGGARPIREAEGRWDMSAEGEVSGQAGLKITAGVSFMRMVRATVGAETGCGFEARTALLDAHSGQDAPESVHACGLCLDVGVNKYVKLDAGLSALGHTLVGRSWPFWDAPLFEGYLSLINDGDSPLGGQVTLGEGECPNRKYRVDLDVNDPDAPGAVKQATVYGRMDGIDHALIRQDAAPMQLYLYPGVYRIESDHLGRLEGRDFEVTEGPRAYTLDFDRVPLDEEHFPDAAFRQYVAESYDRDGDGWLDGFERSVSYMRLSSDRYDAGYIDLFPCQVTSLAGIEYFPELIYLDIQAYDNKVAVLDLTHNTKLENIWLFGLPGERLDISTCMSMKQVHCGNTSLSEINLPRTATLDCLSLWGGQCDWSTAGLPMDPYGFNGNLTSLDISGNPGLLILDVGNFVSLGSLDVSKNPNLLTMTVDHHHLTSLDVSGHTSLHSLTCYTGPLSSLNVAGCTALVNLEIPYNRLTSLNLTGLPALNNINIKDNPGLTVNLTDKPRYSITMSSMTASQRINFADYWIYTDAEGREHDSTEMNEAP